MIKVLNVISDTNIGGAGKDVVTYCNNYNKKKIDLVVVLPLNSLLKPQIEQTGVRIIEVNGMKDKSLDLLAIPKLLSIFKKEKPDIVHTHASFSARIAARLCKNVKIVFTKHCVFPGGKLYNYSFVRKINGWLNKCFADKIIASAEMAKEFLVAQGNDEKIIDVVLNGVDKMNQIPEEKRIFIRQLYGINEKDIVIGMLARIEKLKGHDYFIEAARTLIDKGYTNLKFLIIGTGSYENEIKTMVKRLDLEKYIIFTGFISNVEEILNILDIQVNASYISETTCLSLLEGMSLGIPAVATNCGGNSCVIHTGENGIVVEKESADELVKGIVWLLEDKQRLQEIKKEALSIYEKEFTSKKYAEGFEKVYESLVNKGE